MPRLVSTLSSSGLASTTSTVYAYGSAADLDAYLANKYSLFSLLSLHSMTANERRLIASRITSNEVHSSPEKTLAFLDTMQLASGVTVSHGGETVCVRLFAP